MKGVSPMTNAKRQSPIIIVALITALSLLGDSMLYIVLPIYWKEAGLDSIWQVGLLLSVNRFIRLPFNPIVGWLYQRITLRTGLMIAVILGTVTTIGYGLAQGFIAWLILRSLWGIAWSFFRIGGLSTVVFYSKDQSRGQSMGLYNGLHRTGSLAGMLLGGLLVPFIGLQPVAIGFGCLTLIGLPLIFFALKSGASGESDHSSRTAKVSFSRHTFLLIVSGFIVTMLFQGVFASTISSLLEHLYGVEINVFGLLLSVAFYSGLLQSLRWIWEPYLASRFGHWSDGRSGRLPDPYRFPCRYCPHLRADVCTHVDRLVDRPCHRCHGRGHSPYHPDRCLGFRCRQEFQCGFIPHALFHLSGCWSRSRTVPWVLTDWTTLRFLCSLLGWIFDFRCSYRYLAHHV